MKQQQKKSAFTLIELVLIISLIGILTVVAAPRISNNKTDQLFFSEEIYSTLRYARKVAMNSQCSVAVLFSSTTITLNREADCDGSGGFTESVFEPLSDADHYELQIPEGVTIARTPNDNFYFNDIGQVRSVDSNTITDVALEVEGATITVVGNTGVITK